MRPAAAWVRRGIRGNLRLRAELPLHRCVQGIEFPDAETETRKFVDDLPELQDAAALPLMATAFDRPAFRTPFQQKSSLPAFQKATEDTIGAFNTGVWRTRDCSGQLDLRKIELLFHIVYGSTLNSASKSLVVAASSSARV